MSEILKACPFCGSKYTFVRTTHRKDNISNTQYEVYCAMCSATGGSRLQEEKAIQDWNRRSKIADNEIIEAEDTLTKAINKCNEQLEKHPKFDFSNVKVIKE